MAEKEYIEREKVYADISRHLNGKSTVYLTNYENGYNDGISKAMSVVKKIPAADVRPERHGTWDDSDGEHTKCTICGYFAPIIPQYQDEPITWDAPFCPHCGANMDGKDGNTDE